VVRRPGIEPGSKRWQRSIITHSDDPGACLLPRLLVLALVLALDLRLHNNQNLMTPVWKIS
jgi:hypothetical protein